MYKLEINELGNLIVKKTIKGCKKFKGYDQDGNTINYTKNNNTDYYLYSVDVDKKMDKLFFAQNNGKDKSLQFIEKTNPSLKLDNKYSKLSNFAPLPVDMKTEKQIDGGNKECEIDCNKDASCKYFYNYK